MKKLEIGAKTFLYPMPTTLVGANVRGKPNYLTVAYCGIVNHTPPAISVALGKAHYTNIGIKENGSFSVNIPSEELAKIKGKPVLIEWGNQIRSYVLHPYKMVKDLRTGVETPNVEKVLDGDLDEFIEEQVFAEQKRS